MGTFEGLLHAYHLDPRHQRQPLLLVQLIYLRRLTPIRELVRSYNEYCLFESPRPFFGERLVQVTLHRCASSLKELENVREHIAFEGFFDVKLWDQDDLSYLLTVLKSLGFAHEPALGDVCILADKDL